MDLETDLQLSEWVNENCGSVFEKRQMSGNGALTALDNLMICVWIADYSMRNAGDLASARDLDAEFQQKGSTLASQLGLLRTYMAFALPSEEFERRYFDLIGGIVEELNNMLTVRNVR